MLITVSKESAYKKSKSNISKTFTTKAERLQKQASKKKLQIDIMLKKNLSKNKENWKKANKVLREKSKKQTP